MTGAQMMFARQLALGWRWFLCLGLAAAVAAQVRAVDQAASGEGQPFLQSFSPRDYHANTQCWSAAQDARGVMYIGNYSLALEYDGSAWRSIPTGQSGWINAMAYDAATDRVYVGGHDELGYLQAVPGGGREFVSLLDKAPADARAPGEVRGVYATPDGVFFVGEHQVLRWREGGFKAWRLPTGKQLHSGWAGDHLYVQTREIGLLRLEGDTFAPATADELFHHAVVRSVVTGAGGEVLVATYHDGVFTLRDGTVQPWNGAFNGWLKDNGIYQFLPLRDGSTAVATDTAGFVLLDPQGRFRTRVDNTGGLHGNNLLNLFEDAEGGLWIGLQSGVTRAEISSPFSVLNAAPGEDLSNIVCGGRWFGTMVLGTSSALYRVVPADPATATSAHLERLPGITDTFSSAATVEDGLLLAAAGKIALLDRSAHLVSVLETGFNNAHLCASHLHPGRVYVGQSNGQVRVVQRDAATGRWTDAGTVADLGHEGVIYGLAESRQGDLWIGTNEYGLFRARPTMAGSALAVTPFLDAPGLLHGERSVWVVPEGGPILFQTPHRLYRPDEPGENIRLVSEFGSRLVDGSCQFASVLGSDGPTMWVAAGSMSASAEGMYGRAVAGEPGRLATFQNLPRKVEDVLGQIQGYFSIDPPPAEPTNLLIVGAAGQGVVQLDVPRWEAQPTPAPFATLICRGVAISQGPSANQGLAIGPAALPYARHSVHFDYAAGTLAFGAAPTFQTRLVGLDQNQWLDFNERHSADYFNLPEGAYVFQARARTADGQLGSIASWPFRISPPWTRTAWAYTGYALLLALGMAALVRWRGRQFRRRNTALETLVAARTGELRGREADLVRARDDAESANRAKSAFLANMSHELRTPLNAILGYSQIMAKHIDLPTRTREQVQVIRQSGEHLLGLINEVLDLAKIEAGKLTLAPSDFSLDQLIQDAAVAFRPRLAEKGLTLRQKRASGLPGVVHADVSRLRQVLFNLLGNAVKFTRAGTVWLQVDPAENRRVRFEVGDTGVGIAADQLKAIFTAFHQTGEHSLAAQGTGLGLAISQRLVRQMGGEIAVESTPGRGSRFWFELPLVEGGAKTVTVDGDASDFPVTGYEGAPRRLLVVDDQPENRRVLRDLLQPLGFELEEAADGESTLAACARVWPDAVLLDLRLGTRLDGFEVARTLRARANGRPLGIVAVSASVFEDARQQAVASGCDDFLPKPFEEVHLLAVLSRVLGLRWIYADDPVAPHAPGMDATAADPAPPADVVEALLELSSQGDVVGLREQLDALRAPGAPVGGAVLVRALETLVANYQMDQIHETLLRFQTYERP